MSGREYLLTAAAVVAAAWPAVCQPPTWSAPSLGYVYDASSNAILKIEGVPGAASIDGTVPSPAKLRMAYVAPGQKFAIAQTVDEGTVLLDWSTGGAAVRELTGVVSDISSVAFSSSGNIAAIASAGTGKIQVWRGLPHTPTIQQELASDAAVVAVSDEGTVAGVQADGVYLIGAEDRKHLGSGTFSAIAFRPRTSDLAAAAKDSDRIVSFRTRDGGAQTLASADDGVAEPVGLEFSTDGAKLVIANSRGRSSTILDVNSRTATTIDCGCIPSLAAIATGNSVFRITGPSGSPEEPLVFVDAASANPRVFLVPALVAATGVSR